MVTPSEAAVARSAVLISALSSATSVSSSIWRWATSTLKADESRQSEVSSTRSQPGRNHRTDDDELQGIGNIGC